MLRIQVPNAPPDFVEKVEAALLSQVPKIADQVCDGMLVTGAVVSLKNRHGPDGPDNVIGFIGPSPRPLYAFPPVRLPTLIRPLFGLTVSIFHASASQPLNLIFIMSIVP